MIKIAECCIANNTLSLPCGGQSAAAETAVEANIKQPGSVVESNMISLQGMPMFCFVPCKESDHCNAQELRMHRQTVYSEVFSIASTEKVSRSNKFSDRI